MQEENQAIDNAESQEQKEKMLNQSEVNRLVGRAKAEAQERAKREAEREFQAKIEQLQAQKQQAEARGEDTREIDVDSIYQQIQERMHQEQMRREMEKVADNYLQKLSKGRERYDDFEDTTKDFNAAEFPQLVYLLANIDNAADVLYDLSKNPQKLATIDYLSQRSPMKAKSELERIAKSIESQRAAKNEMQQEISEPLDRLQPASRTNSNGKMSVSDLRNQEWLRG